MTIFWQNGLGGTLGDSLATCKPLYTQQDVWFVSSLIGTDAASPAGKNREEPLASLAGANGAFNNSTAGDIIVLMDGHTETLTSNLNVNKQLTIVGEGLSSGIPTATLTPNFNGVMLTLAAAGCQLRGIKFGPNGAATASATVQVNGVEDCQVRGCYFQCGPNDGGGKLQLVANSHSFRLINSTFISTAVSRASQPVSAILLSGACSDLVMEGVTVSAGAYGFSGVFAVDLSNFALTRPCIEGLSLLLGADLSINSGTTDGYCNVQTVSGGSRGAW